MTIKYSIIIPTFNRCNFVIQAINSAIEFVGDSIESYEIIVVDDSSTDGTFDKLLQIYSYYISVSFIKLIRTSKNSGVVAARKLGAELACGIWLLPIDSDNELIPNMRHQFELIISRYQKPCILFRTVDSNDLIIGSNSMDSSIEISTVFYKDFPELFGVYDRNLFIEYFGSQVLIKLRRFESIGFYRILRDYGPFQINDLRLRRYHFHSLDRLSSRVGVLKDSGFMSTGYFLLITEFYSFMPYSLLIKKFIICLYYRVFHIFNFLFNIYKFK